MTCSAAIRDSSAVSGYNAAGLAECSHASCVNYAKRIAAILSTLKLCCDISETSIAMESAGGISGCRYRRGDISDC